MRKFFFFVASSNAVKSGYDQGERCLSAVCFALLTCWHVQFSKTWPSFFLHKLTSIYRQNWSCEKIPKSQNSDKVASFSSVVVNRASSVQKVSYSKPLQNKFLPSMSSTLGYDILVFFKSSYYESWQNTKFTKAFLFCFIFTASRVNITS